MNPGRLIDHFDRISDAPDAVPRLRGFILDLAVRGKLVEQDQEDEPASELLMRIQAERVRLVDAGALRGCAALPPAKTDEVPFDVPASWALIRLGEALELTNGRAFKPTEWSKAGLPIIRIQNLNNPGAPFNFCDRSVPQKLHVTTGDLLISWSGTPSTSFGAHIWDRGHAILNQHIFRAELISDAFRSSFLKLAINSRLLELIAQAHGGVGLQHITKPKLERLALTLPPLEEQQRIVAKVDELMALCDRLGAAQAERERRRDRLAAASLHRLSQPADMGKSPTFREHARFHLSNLSRFTTRPDQIPVLRQSILNLAVRGCLVAQNPVDEPVFELIKRIQSEQAEVVRLGELKRHDPSTAFHVLEVPFDLPSSWQWTTLERVIVFGPQNGVSPKPSSRPDAPKAITLSATTKGIFQPQYFKHVEAMIPKDSEFWLRTGDLLFQRGNTREYVGIAAYYDGEPERFLYPDLMMKVRLSKQIDLRFVHLWSIAPFARTYFSTHASGAQSTMPKINQATLVRLPLALPPVAEQHRIVAKVDELMAVCDRFEAQLTTAQTESRLLLEAVLHEALVPAA